MSRFINGSAIVLTLIAIAAMTTVMLGVAQLVPKDFRQSQAFEASLQAEQAAWAGVEHALLLLRESNQKNEFYELAKNNTATNYPYGYYSRPIGQVDCYDSSNREDSECQGFDRRLGVPKNQEPFDLKNINPLTSDTSYRLTIWHKHQRVGSNELDDGLPSTINQYLNPANINPSLVRDEVRYLDFRGVSVNNSIRVFWRPYVNTTHCQVDNSDITSQLVYTQLRSDGTIIDDPRARGTSEYTKGSEAVISINRLPDASILSFRLLVNENGQGDEKVTGCFARYRTELTDPGTGIPDTFDLGYDVIDSEGLSNGVRRKIRVIVDRQNGRILNSFDFGLYSQCENTGNCPTN